MRKLINKTQGLIKGMPSAMLISILIHAGLIILATGFVVLKSIKEREVEFVPPPAVERPKMKLRKPKVKMKKSTPKPTTRIVTKVQRATMPDIQLPEMSGGDGLIGDIGGFELTIDVEQDSIFGGAQTIGNDFVGTFYDLKRGRTGREVPMDGDTFRDVLRDFVTSGWKTSKLARYYRSPKKLYTTHFMIPPIPAPMAPDVFGEPNAESYFFFLHYKGKLVYKEDITFRFRITGDAYMFVRVDKKDVGLACWDFHKAWFDWWTTNDSESEKHYLGNQQAAVSDWITLEAGKPVDMETVFGEWQGGIVSALLTVEVKGVEYPRNKYGAPILPAFKTSDLSLNTIEDIEKLLPANEATLTNGPVFRDY